MKRLLLLPLLLAGLAACGEDDSLSKPTDKYDWAVEEDCGEGAVVDYSYSVQRAAEGTAYEVATFTYQRKGGGQITVEASLNKDGYLNPTSVDCGD